MAGYQTIEALRPILHRGPPPMPVVNIALVRPVDPRTQRRNEMRARRAAGVPQEKIAAEFGVSRRTVERATKDVPPPASGWRKGGVAPKFNKAKAQRMHRSGFSYTEIAEDLGCSRSTVRNMVRGFREDHKSGRRRRLTLRVEEMVARATRQPVERIRVTSEEGSKGAEIVKARHICFWLATKQFPDVSLNKICRSLGGFHHATAGHAIAKVEAVVAALGLQSDPLRGKLCRKLYSADWGAVQ